MTPLHLIFIMSFLCLLVIPYLFITFKKLWSIPNDEEHQQERKIVARRIIVLLGVLGTLAFVLPLLMKFNSEYGQ